MIFDSSRDFPFLEAEKDGAGVLAAEALLASVEVKSKLTAQEIEKSCNAARELRRLKPYGAPLVGADLGDADGGRQNRARYTTPSSPSIRTSPATIGWRRRWDAYGAASSRGST